VEEGPLPEPDPAPGWREDWRFAFWSPDGSLGAVQSLTRRRGRTAVHCALLGAGRAPVVLADDDIAAVPDPRYLELRSEGVWVQHVCERPFDRWTLGLEAFAVRHEDPAEGLRTGWGERLGLAFDLDWEATAEPDDLPGGYGQWGEVHGEVLVGEEVIDGSWLSHRRHRRGVPPGAELEAAVVLAGAVHHGEQATTWAGRALPGPFELAAGEVPLAGQPLALATWRDGDTAVAAGLSRLVADSARTAVGWTTWRSDAS
jgi:hypothetical protein